MEETKIIIIALVMLVASALQIVLFFKVWIMTNDVRALRENYVKYSNFAFDIRKMLLFGEKEKARDILLDRFIEKIENFNYDGIEHNEYYETVKQNIDNKFNEAKKEFEFSLKKIGEELPESIKNLRSGNDFYKLF
jgi:hypothetical protein